VHDDGYFDERVAATYESQGETFDPAVIDLTVDVLAALAGEGRALEFGIGTGRIALPLARRGVPVHGIDLSKAMVTRLRAKPGGDDIGVTIGDLATTTVDGSFSLAYLVFNTIMNLTTQAAQVACFRNAAAHLEPGGCFPITTSHPHAEQAAEAAEGAAAQGRFWEMHDHLYENQQHLSEDDLHSYARVLDLDLDLFGKGLAEHVDADRVHEDFLSGVRSGVNGTPTFFINGRRHDDSYESETLLMALQRAAELGEED
jgi:SAM-dependent methyltransferase